MNNVLITSLTRSLKWLFTRVTILYALLFILIFTTIDISAVSSRIKIRRLNDLRPDMGELVQLNNNKLDARKVRWSILTNYFDTILEYMPDAGVPLLFKGVARYYSTNSIAPSLAEVRRSADKFPYIFWNLYDTAVLSFMSGDLSTAVLYLNRSLMIPSSKAESAIRGEVLYRQLMSSPSFDTDLTA